MSSKILIDSIKTCLSSGIEVLTRDLNELGHLRSSENKYQFAVASYRKIFHAISNAIKQEISAGYKVSPPSFVETFSEKHAAVTRAPISEIISPPKPKQEDQEVAVNEVVFGEFVIMPVDSLVLFSRSIGIGAMSISMKLMLDGAMKLNSATVYDIASGSFYTAVLDGGAFLNDQKIRNTTIKKPISALIFGISRLDGSMKFDIPSEARSQLHNKKQFLNIKNLAFNAMNSLYWDSPMLTMCYVASGKIDIGLLSISGDDDIIASYLVAKEAGIKITTLDGKDYIPSEEGRVVPKTLLCCHESLFDKTIEAINSI